ncbi:heavy-metal-associated domain-containing protein [Janibacter sp. G1551]|uniref:heavy-metal-associated domain-containing protein n=1 Tax=Janibacter sp. G1551 TaxID=3420440 RepID=UPI003CFDD900
MDHARTALPLVDNGGGCACCSTPTTTGTTGSTPHPAAQEALVSTQTFPVTGMTCGHCVSAVTSELKAIHGVTDVAVELVAGGTSTVTVKSEHPVEETAVEAALDEAGDYQLA